MSSWQKQIGGQFDDTHQLIMSVPKTASAEWEGAAAGAMHSDVTPMAQFVLDAKDVTHSVGQAAGDQASHFSDVKNKMPPPVTVITTDSCLSRGWAHMIGGQTDAEEQQALAASDKAAAVYSDQPRPVSHGPGGAVQPHDFRQNQPAPPVGHDTPPIETQPPTTIQHVPVSPPPTPGPPGSFPPVSEPVRPPGGRTQPIDPIGLYGLPGAGGGPHGCGSTRGKSRRFVVRVRRAWRCRHPWDQQRPRTRRECWSGRAGRGRTGWTDGGRCSWQARRSW